MEAWIDRFGSWLAALSAKADAGQDVENELIEGGKIVERAAATVRLKPDTTYGGSTHDEEARRLLEIAAVLRSDLAQSVRVAAARDPELARLMNSRPDRSAAATADRPLKVIGDPVRARFGAWYELFARSCTSDAERPGTLRDVERRLPEIADLGFDVLYLAPIHPIGSTNRKGRNNALRAAAGDPGSPWAIGSDAGGHTAIDPGLGTLEDFDRLVATAGHVGIGYRARSGVSGVARPSLDEVAAGMVPAPCGWLDQVRRKSAEEVPGHLPLRLRNRRLARAMGQPAGCRPVLGRPRRQDFPRRQSAYEAVRVLGVADCRRPPPASGCDLPLRSLHPTQGDAAPREARVQSVVHVLHLAEHGAGVEGVSDRAHAHGSAGISAAQLLRQHTRHPSRVPATRRAPRLRSPPDSCRDAGGKLRHLQRLRALRERCRQPGLGGVPALGKVRDSPAQTGISRAISTSLLRA